MENNDFKLDDFLRTKVENTHIPINEMHWEDALRRLDDGEESKKGGFLFWSVLILFISLASLGTYLFFPKNNKKAIAKNETINNYNTKNENKLYGDTIENFKSANENIKSNKYNKSESIRKINNNEQILKQIDQENNSTNTNPIIEKDAVKKSEDKVKRSASENQNIVNGNTIVSNNVNNNKISIENKKSNIDKNQNNNNRNEENIAKINNIKSKKIKAKSGNDNVKNIIVEEDKEKEVIANNNSKVTSTLESTKKQEPKLLNPTSFSALNPRYVKGLENYTNSKNNDTAELSLAQIEKLSAKNNKDTTLLQNASSIKKPIKIIDKSKAGFFTDVQLNYSKGFKKSSNSYNSNSNPVLSPVTSNEPVKWSIAPYLGVGYRFPISNRIDFFGSLAWTMQNNLNIDDYSYKIKYGFGKDSSSMIVNRKSQIQLEMPLQIGFKINNSSMLIGGFGLNYGLDVYSSVKEFETESFKNKFGFRSGINSFDLIALFGYAYKINNNIMLQANYSKGFIDKTNNSYFNNLNKDNTQRFSIGMKYLFNKKK